MYRYRNHRNPQSLWAPLAVLLLLLAGLFFSGALNDHIFAADTETGATTQVLPTVETVTVQATLLRTWHPFSGKLSAVEQAEIRPLVSGTIQAVLFEEGALVEQGQPLFLIDPRPFEAVLQNARAELASAESDAALAEVEHQRAVNLARNNVISQSVRDNRSNDLKMATARVEAARARVMDAELDVEYANIRSPITGRIGRAEITVGNVIEAGSNAPVLTTVVSLDRLFAEFDVDESTYFQIKASATVSDVETGEKDIGKNIPISIHINAQNDSDYQGRLHAFDNQFDSHTGTIRARAVVDNSGHSLVPGVFVKVRVGSPVEEPTLMIPERAIGISQDKRYVYVVNADDRIEYREITLGQQVDGQRVVLSGVVAGDRVVINGVQRVASDMQVLVADR